ncbi:subunit 17 of mediator complex-domain-containing protein [Cristinia sonorae]|uniref:Mediator of RNA polymerase II transcription subunit 17 n=1 Tax=Cristinia sonorae TaxID=1940300 RepID=A0A8K0UVG3_9AGAR|nr:subunit 17 of mediator complex-domain-containing protein [Cristinia sonorae]
MAQEPEWKKLKLSLERPYKDEQGQPIPVVLDITPEGQQIYEPQKDLTTVIGENLHRIFSERGHDFFDKRIDDRKHELRLATQEGGDASEPTENSTTNAMTPEELFQLRMKIIPQLHVALGEMSQARDLLSVLLATDSTSRSTSQPSTQLSLSQMPLSQLSLSQPLSQSLSQAPPDIPTSSLTATTVAKPPAIQSVQTFNTQLAIGSKDTALRHAVSLFKSAAQGMEKSRIQSEKYWVDALKMRRNNWGLVPAPLPPGSSTGKGADRTAKDFLVSFGLEESPVMFKRRAVGRMSTIDTDIPHLEFPLRQNMRLQVSLVCTNPDGSQVSGRSDYTRIVENTTEKSLRAAQTEVVEQEIFSILIREASNLPTASARVSERLIVIEAAQATELQFELVASDYVPQDSSSKYESLQASCDLIYAFLHLLLLRAHGYAKSQRLRRTVSAGPSQASTPPLTLQPIIDMLQYQVFCQRVQAEISRMVRALSDAGIHTKLYFNAVGESGEELIRELQLQGTLRLSGECLLRIEHRRSLRFTFSSPSTLTANLSQATLPITSIPQLVQLLADEVESCLLQRICEIGAALCEHVHGTWFVDSLSGRAVGRWEGNVLNFRISFTNSGAILCSASRMERGDQHPDTHLDIYSSDRVPGVSLLHWIQKMIENAMTSA